MLSEVRGISAEQNSVLAGAFFFICVNAFIIMRLLGVVMLRVYYGLFIIDV